jgi:hypothetical protein
MLPARWGGCDSRRPSSSASFPVYFNRVDCHFPKSAAPDVLPKQLPLNGRSTPWSIEHYNHVCDHESLNNLMRLETPDKFQIV